MCAIEDSAGIWIAVSDEADDADAPFIVWDLRDEPAPVWDGAYPLDDKGNGIGFGEYCATLAEAECLAWEWEVGPLDCDGTHCYCDDLAD